MAMVTTGIGVGETPKNGATNWKFLEHDSRQPSAGGEAVSRFAEHALSAEQFRARVATRASDVRAARSRRESGQGLLTRQEASQAGPISGAGALGAHESGSRICVIAASRPGGAAVVRDRVFEATEEE